MARPPRHDVPGALHHVTFRGDGGERLFGDDRDRSIFLEELHDAVVAFEWLLLSYCLMPNHVHLLVECPQAGLSAGMQRLESRYARRLHRRYATYGHVYQGRFKSQLLRTDEHFLMTVAYIARNPVAADMCEDPAGWAWSSHRAVMHERSELVAVERLFARLAGRGGDGRYRYLALVGCSIEDVPPPMPLVRRPPLAKLLARPDAAAIVEAHVVHGYGVREIATHVGCSAATVSRRLKQAWAGASS